MMRWFGFFLFSACIGSVFGLSRPLLAETVSGHATPVPTPRPPNQRAVENDYGLRALVPASPKILGAAMVEELIHQNFDFSRIFFLKADVDALRKKDAFKAYCTNDHAWVDKILEMAKQRRAKVREILDSFQDKTFDLESKEETLVDHDYPTFASDEAELKQRWTHIVASSLITKLAEKDIKDPTKEELDDAKKEVLKALRDFLKKLDEEATLKSKDQKYVAALKARLGCGDPYAAVFPDDREEKASEWCGVNLAFDGSFPSPVVTSLSPGSQVASLKTIPLGAPIDRATLQLKSGKTVSFAFSDDDGGRHAFRKFLKLQSAGVSKCVFEVVKGKEREKIVVSPQTSLKPEHTVKMRDLVDSSKRVLRVISIPDFFYGDPAEGKWSVGTAQQVLALLKAPGKYDGVVLDLQNNGGGSTQEANTLIAMFLDKDRPESLNQLTTRGSRGQTTAPDVVMMTETFPDMPLFILTNHRTASASEMVTAALREKGRALVLGDRTFGKATQMTLHQAQDDELLYQFTTGIRTTPQGKSYQGKGIAPDLVLPTQSGAFPNEREKFNPDVKVQPRGTLSFERPEYLKMDRDLLPKMQAKVDAIYDDLKIDGESFAEATKRVRAILGKEKRTLSLKERLAEKAVLDRFWLAERSVPQYHETGFSLDDLTGPPAIAGAFAYLTASAEKKK